MKNKDILLKRLQICDFVLHEAALYLDSYPNDAMALDYFDKHNIIRREVLKEYAENYGPISKSDCANKGTWEWINDPWPWENEGDDE